jgi:hypothetical protein
MAQVVETLPRKQNKNFRQNCREPDNLNLPLFPSVFRDVKFVCKYLTVSLAGCGGSHL